MGARTGAFEISRFLEILIMALVLKKWRAESTPRADGNFVHIVGREAGLVSFFMSLVGVDSTSEVAAQDRVILYKESSLAGFTRRVIPYSSISSAFYGYHKPWKEALILGLVLVVPTVGLGLVLALLYYFLNKKLSVGIVEHSGVVWGFAFKRSVIEGIKIDETEAEYMIGIIRMLIENNAGTGTTIDDADEVFETLEPFEEMEPEVQVPQFKDQEPQPLPLDVQAEGSRESFIDEQAAKELYAQARSLASEGKRDQAIAVLMEIVDRFPGTKSADKAKRTLNQA